MDIKEFVFEQWEAAKHRAGVVAEIRAAGENQVQATLRCGQGVFPTKSKKKDAHDPARRLPKDIALFNGLATT